MNIRRIKLTAEIPEQSEYCKSCLELLSTVPSLVVPFSRTVNLQFEPQITDPEIFIPKNTYDIAKLGRKSLAQLLERHKISKGEVVLRRHLPNAKGAGYDWIPDEDDYDETYLIFKYPSVRLSLVLKEEEDAQRLITWYISCLKQE
jgi:hypothetical protein